jgi:hypothetical protein
MKMSYVKASAALLAFLFLVLAAMTVKDRITA